MKGILAGELKHGPLGLIDENMPVILIMTRDSLYPKMQSALTQVTARMGQPIILCHEDDQSMSKTARAIRISTFCKIRRRPPEELVRFGDWLKSLMGYFCLSSL